MRRSTYILAAPAALIAGFMAACRFSPALAAGWQAAAALPILRGLHRLTAHMAAPALEWAAPALAGGMLLALSFRRSRALAGMLLAVAAAFALLWYPAYWSRPGSAFAEPDAARIEALCHDLIDRLDDAQRRAMPIGDALARAGGVAGIPGARVKAAGHPGWMRALRIAGLFSPWTGEAIVDPGASPCLAPFTAVHELMHLQGIADEGQANIAAWQRCIARGGPFADSARLWALRYALRALNRADPAACLRAMGRVGEDLRALCAPAAEAAPTALSRLCAALGIGEAAASYDDLVGWLIGSGGR